MISAITPGAASSNRHAIEARFKVALAAQADHLFGYLAVLEKQKRGNRPDPIFRGAVLMIIDIDLADVDLAGIFLRQFIKNRPDHFAGATPFGPEINEDRRGSLQY